MGNPELLRNLWLEFSPQRLLVMPLVLAGVFYVAFESGGAPLVAATAWWAYVLLGMVWGTRLAADAVPAEVQARTWDWQRLSALGPWTLTWGKLLGAPAYAWYGALPALAVLAAADIAGGRQPEVVTLRVVVLLLAAGCAHGVGMMMGLHGVRRRDSLAAGRGLWALLAGLLAAVPWLGLEHAVELGRVQPVTWFDQRWLGLEFGLASAALFTALAWLACWRLMRAELRLRAAPWTWIASVLFLMLYAAGFVEVATVKLASEGMVLRWFEALFDLAPGGTRALAAMYVALLLAYLMALWEPKSGVTVARARQAAARGDWALVACLVPRWCYALLLAVVAGVVVVALAPERAPGTRGLFDSGVLVTAQLLFALRDTGLLVLLHLAADTRRADLAWLVYLGVLYVLAPAVALTIGAHSLTGAFVPRPDLDVAAGVLPVLAQVGVVAALVAWRWRARVPVA